MDNWCMLPIVVIKYGSFSWFSSFYLSSLSVSSYWIFNTFLFGNASDYNTPANSLTFSQKSALAILFVIVIAASATTLAVVVVGYFLILFLLMSTTCTPHALCTANVIATQLFTLNTLDVRTMYLQTKNSTNSSVRFHQQETHLLDILCSPLLSFVYGFLCSHFFAFALFFCNTFTTFVCCPYSCRV